MSNLLIYGGYHQSYIYTNHLSVGIANIKNINTFNTFYKIENNRFLRKKNHYFPPINDVKNYLEELIIKNKITHIINYNTNHFSKYLISFFQDNYKLKIAVYYNDSPFSSHPSKLIYYYNQKNTFKKYDYIFVYRNEDQEKLEGDYNIQGKKIKIVPPSCPEKKYLKYIKSTDDYLYDFAFVGHYESDGRLNVIDKLISLGYKCLVVGLKWPENFLDYSSFGKSKVQKRQLGYTDYLSMLSSARVNLGFLSKINNDFYTRRYFECPFSNSLFLAYDSKLYRNLSCNMPNIFFTNNLIPKTEDCIKALEFSKLNSHYPNEEQKKIFYERNSIINRANLFKDFLDS